MHLQNLGIFQESAVDQQGSALCLIDGKGDVLQSNPAFNFYFGSSDNVFSSYPLSVLELESKFASIKSNLGILQERKLVLPLPQKDDNTLIPLYLGFSGKPEIIEISLTSFGKIDEKVEHSLFLVKFLGCGLSQTNQGSLEPSFNPVFAADRLSRIGRWQMNLKDQEVIWSDNLYNLYGVKREQGADLFKLTETLVPKDDFLRLNHIIDESIKQNRVHHEGIHRLITPAGEERYFLSRWEVVRNSGGEAEKLIGTSQDVTELLEVKQVLKWSESRLQYIQRIAKIGNWEWEPETDTFHWSPDAYQSFLPFKVSKSNSFNEFLDWVYMDDREKVKNRFFKPKNEDLLINPLRFEFSPGKIMHLSFRGLVEKDSSGAVKRIYGTAQDLSDYFTANEALKKSRERLRQAQKIAKIGHLEYDLRTGEMEWSEHASQLLGMGHVSIHSGLDEFLNRIHLDDLIKVNNSLQKAIENTELFEINFRTFVSGKKLSYFYCKTDFIYDKEGKPAFLMLIIQDISEKIGMEEALKIKQSNMESVIENTDDIIWSLDINHNLLVVNSKFRQISQQVMGHSLQVGDNFFKELPGAFKDFWNRVHNKTVLGRKSFFEEEVSFKGKTYWFEVSCIPLTGSRNEISGACYTARDISKKKINESLLIEYHKKQKEFEVRQEKVKSQALIQGQEEERRRVSMELHDGVGQILTAINFNMKKLQREIEKTEINQQHLESMTNLPTLIESAYQEVRRISYNLMPQILNDFGIGEATLQLTKNLFDGHNVQIRMENGIGNKRYSNEIEVGVFRIAQEVLNNSSKYAFPTQVNIYLFEEESMLLLDIEDNGKGFELEKVKKGKEYKGLGLSNIAQRVNLLGGYFHMDSKPGSGTRTVVKIPLVTKVNWTGTSTLDNKEEPILYNTINNK